MQINKLNYFICVAEYLNFTKAAEECHLAQSAMSQQINSLESELGFKLFNRTSKNVSLTECGKVFYKNIKNVMNDYNVAVKKAESAASGYKGTITIGICGQIEEVILPDVLKSLREDYPLIEFVFKKANVDRVPQELREGIYDAVFTWPYDLVNSTDIGYKVVLKEKACALMNYDNPLAAKKSLTISEISKCVNFVIAMNTHTVTFKHFSSFYDDEQFKDVVIKSVESDSILRMMLKMNFGISVVPEILNKSMGEEFACVPIEGSTHEVEYCIAYLKENSNPCFNIFMKYMKL